MISKSYLHQGQYSAMVLQIMPRPVFSNNFTLNAKVTIQQVISIMSRSVFSDDFTHVKVSIQQKLYQLDCSIMSRSLFRNGFTYIKVSITYKMSRSVFCNTYNIEARVQEFFYL